MSDKEDNDSEDEQGNTDMTENKQQNNALEDPLGKTERSLLIINTLFLEEDLKLTEF